MLEIYPLTSQPKVKYIERPEADLPLQEEVEAVWKKLLSNNPSLFNAPLFSLEQLDLDSLSLSGYFVPYKYWLFQRQNPDLYSQLKIRPLAVSGVISVNGEYLLGKRSEKMTQDPGLWEFCPSGGIDSDSLTDDHIDFLGQLYKEFNEELQWDKNTIKTHKVFALAVDSEEKVADICVQLELKEKLPLPQPNEEYSEFLWLKSEDLYKISQKSEICSKLLEFL